MEAKHFFTTIENRSLFRILSPPAVTYYTVSQKTVPLLFLL